MRVLAVDTSTAATSVALVGPSLRVERHEVDARRHAEVLEPLLREVLAEATDSGAWAGGIDLVACGVGPGPFTGLRVGIAAALAFGVARDIPVVGACSLDVTARRAVTMLKQPVTVFTRARRAELCWATYDARGMRLGGPIIRREPVEVAGACVGDAGPVDELMHPRAIDLADLVLERLAAGEDLPDDVALPEDDAADSGATAADVLTRRIEQERLLLPPRPIYLRRPDAVVPASLAGPAGEGPA